MKPILLYLGLLVFSNLNAQRNLPDLSFVLTNDDFEISNKLNDIKMAYNLSQGQVDILEVFINDRFDTFGVDSNLSRPNITFDVEAWKCVNIYFNSPDDYNIWIDHLNLDLLIETHQTYVGNAYRFAHSSFNERQLNILAVTNINNLKRPEGVYFIITDMDRL